MSNKKNKRKYTKTLHQQVYERLTSMLAFGESKHEDKGSDEARDKIYSYSTYETYKKHIGYFIKWLKEEHPEVRSLRKAKRYVNEWLWLRTETKNANGDYLSAWTIQTEAAALNKLFGIDKADVDRFQPPTRHRADIKRSRGDAARDRDFSLKNNDYLIKFCRATGCRRNIVAKATGDDYWPRIRMETEVQRLIALQSEQGRLSSEDLTMLNILQDALTVFPEETDFLLHRRDKGGRNRFAPIIGSHKEQVIERLRDTPKNQRVFFHVASHADIHGYRADYTATLYKKYARDTDSLKRKEVYYCQKDEAGRKLDRAAMQKCSKALGHNRIDVVSLSYLHGI